jgi:hypothetical protein
VNFANGREFLVGTSRRDVRWWASRESVASSLWLERIGAQRRRYTSIHQHQNRRILRRLHHVLKFPNGGGWRFEFDYFFP